MVNIGTPNAADKRPNPAVDIIKQIGPLIKGGGGGQPEFATAGVKEPCGIADALKKEAELLG